MKNIVLAILLLVSTSVSAELSIGFSFGHSPMYHDYYYGPRVVYIYRPYNYNFYRYDFRSRIAIRAYDRYNRSNSFLSQKHGYQKHYQRPRQSIGSRRR